MGKRQRNRLRARGLRKLANESKAVFLKRSGGKTYDISGTRNRPVVFRSYAEPSEADQ